MPYKAIFLDLDGTVIGHDNTISVKTKEAIQQARVNGHKVFICTGRPVAEIFNPILAIGFDGMICSNGGYIEIENKIIVHKKIPLDILQKFDAFFSEHNIVYSVETNHGIFASKAYLSIFDEMFQKKLANLPTDVEKRQTKESMDQWLTIFTISEHLILNNVNNISFIAQKQEDIDNLFSTFGNDFEIYQNVVPIFGEFSGEISLQGITKGFAVQTVADYLELPIQNTIGIGDGMNDLSMLEISGIGVAMGNSKEELKQKADFVTGDIENEGLYQAFIKLNII